MLFIQNAAQQEPKIAQTTVLGILVASTLIVLGLLGLIGIFAWKRMEDAQRRAAVERVADAEERVEAAPEQAKPAWDLARATLDEYFQRNLGQIRLIFLLSVFVMLVGFLVICFGVLRAFQSPAVLLPATIATLAGVITEFIGAQSSLGQLFCSSIAQP
jgi:Flp pilus assembly protein TadB